MKIRYLFSNWMMGVMEMERNGMGREGGYVRGMRLPCWVLGTAYDDRALEGSAGFVRYHEIMGWGRVGGGISNFGTTKLLQQLWRYGDNLNRHPRRGVC
jgi:hypothetical protein